MKTILQKKQTSKPSPKDIERVAVSYTHLDVYKRQILFLSQVNFGKNLKY